MQWLLTCMSYLLCSVKILVLAVVVAGGCNKAVQTNKSVSKTDILSLKTIQNTLYNLNQHILPMFAYRMNTSLTCRIQVIRFEFVCHLIVRLNVQN